MPSIAETIRRLRAGEMAYLGRSLPGGMTTGLQDFDPLPSSRLKRLPSADSNPGALDGWYFVPSTTGALPLVVVLHGCTQSAAGYDYGSGWSDLAERFGFAVLFPEQLRTNNPNLCFNWFLESDTVRGGGEPLSIRQMIAAMAERHSIDVARVFVTGLSAGGAMANVMLATYPELFAGGSIIGGLPYGSASSVPQALERMRGSGHASAADYARLVRSASSHQGKWPRVTVWHGDADRTVDHANAKAIIGQWRDVHGVKETPDVVDVVDGQPHRTWLSTAGGIAIDEYIIAGFGHGTPLKTASTDSCGNIGPYMLEAGISSTWRQAQSWGLIDAACSAAVAASGALPAQTAEEPKSAAHADLAAGLNATIERALRSAGLQNLAARTRQSR